MQMAELWERFLRVASSSSIPDESKGATEYDVIFQEGSLKLLRYRSEHTIGVAEPILICFSLVNRPYILDLQADRSVVRQLLKQGFEVFLIDWGIPSVNDHSLRLYDYICERMKNLVELACLHADSQQVSLLGYCMGGTMSAMFAALYPERVRNLVLLAAPIDFESDESLLNLWAREEYFDVDGVVDAFGNCPGFLLQICFQLMKPVHNYVKKYMSLSDRSTDHAFLDNFFAMERWANDNIPVAGETFREFVKMLYQQNRLTKGQMQLNHVPIDLSNIICPTLMLTAEFDHLVPPSSTLAIREHVGTSEVEAMSINTGHIGLAVSSKAHRQLWPKASNWIAEHSNRRGESTSQ
jgi:polyhydroxyalkanoate synthase